MCPPPPPAVDSFSLLILPARPLRLPAPPPVASAQPCGGAIPICMVEEFDLPMEIIDRRVTKMKMISPSNREVDVGKTLNDKVGGGAGCSRLVQGCWRVLAGAGGGGGWRRLFCVPLRRAMPCSQQPPTSHAGMALHMSKY